MHVNGGRAFECLSVVVCIYSAQIVLSANSPAADSLKIVGSLISLHEFDDRALFVPYQVGFCEVRYYF